MHSEEKVVHAGFGVILLKGGKVLLGRRHSDPDKADSELHGEDTWTFPGGKHDFGEELAEGATREVKEETDIDVKPDDLEVFSVTNDMVPTAHFVTIGFIAKRFSGEPKVMEPDEIVQWKWFSLNALPSPMFKPSAKMIKNFKEGVVYRRD